MRVKRVDKFRKLRHKKARNLVFMMLILPGASIFAGYIITTLLILPSINK